MRFGYVLSPHPGAVGFPLRETADALAAQGIALAGAVERPNAG